MATVLTNPQCFQGDPGDPPEYRSTSPTTCASCGEEHDLDDGEEETFRYDNAANVQCIEGCYDAAQTELFRAEVKSTIVEKAGELEEAVRDLCSQYERKCDVDNRYDSLAAMTETVTYQVKRYADGLDSGWRGGCCLSYGLGEQVILALEEKLAMQSRRMHDELDIQGLRASQGYEVLGAFLTLYIDSMTETHNLIAQLRSDVTAGQGDTYPAPDRPSVKMLSQRLIEQIRRDLELAQWNARWAEDGVAA